MPHPIPGRRAVFLDRDGTLNKEVNYLHRVEDFVWIPGAPHAVRRLNEAGLLAVVVTNQGGVAHGYFGEEAVRRLHRAMQASLKAQAGARLDAFYFCPYHPHGVVARYRRTTAYRKPGPGMFVQAIRAWSIDPARSFAVGDRNSDLDPARCLGMTTLLVQTGYGATERAATRADYVVEDVGGAVAQIEELCATTP